MTNTKKKADTRANTLQRMGEPPKQSFINDMLNTAPLKSSIVRLNLDNIQRYERNPRFTRNPAYDEIKDSIRERGLDDPLVVTLRPGDRHHTLSKGGGTRLKILQELWAETGDKRFYELEVVVEPYKSELDLFINHGNENLLKGRMSFIEASKFYCDLKQFHEDLEGRELSAREACELINKDGFSSIDHPRLIRYTYALHLYQSIPLIFEAGLGRTTVDLIRKHEKATREIWQQHSDNLEQFERLWGESLVQHDHDDPDLPFDLHGVQASFETAAGALLGVPPQHLSAMVDLVLQQPDRTAMSALNCGPVRSPAPSSTNSPAGSQSPLSAEFTQAPDESGEHGDDDDSELPTPLIRPLVQPERPPTQPSAPVPGASLVPTATEVTQQQRTASPSSHRTPRHGHLSLLHPHIQIAKGPNGGFEYLRAHVEQNLAGWESPRDNEPIFFAAKPVISWSNALLSYFEVPSIPEAGDPPEQHLYASLTDRQLHLRAPSRYLTGDHVFDHVWLSIAQIFYGPVLLERNPTSMNEFTALLECCKAFGNTEDGEVEIPTLQLQRVIYLHAISRLILSDPAHKWLDQALHTLQGAAHDYQIARRQHTNPNINSLAPIALNNQR